MEILSLLVVFLMLGFGFIYWFTTRPKEEGTLQERQNNPELNTNSFDLHKDRIFKFDKSKYKGDMYYIGPRGGYYYYQNGRKVYL